MEAASPTAPAVRFPALVTDDLNGDRQKIPATLPGQLKLFLIAYQREQQADLDPWLTIGLGLERRHAGFRVYELPTLSARWQVARGWIDDGMRRGIPGREARARTLTLYLDTAAFNRALALPDDRSVYALLVDASGAVVWRQAGRPDDASAATLGREVAARLDAAR
ncbi:MAG: hypothetical protein R3B06_12390 [Kofleriaceae bacterium]